MVPIAQSRPIRVGLTAALVPGLLLASALSFTACAPTGFSPAGVSRSPAGDSIRSLLVYVIHGDGDYIYHDSKGRRRLADEDALAQAREVARNAPQAEVFIFHQKPRWHLWSHPSRDGVMSHYRGGVLLRERNYSRRGKGSDFAAEAALFDRHALPRHLPPKTCAAAGDTTSLDSAAAGRSPPGPGSRGPDRYFVYFGHEIPVLGGRGYSHSRPGEEFTLEDFSRGLRRFVGPPCPAKRPLALLALSSCRGGTPATTSTLFPFSDFVLASPTPLHLSFLDTRALIPLIRDAAVVARPAGPDMAARQSDRIRARAEQMARESFASLQGRTQTEISISLYDSEKASAYLEAHVGPRDRDGEIGDGVRMSPMGYKDCGEDPDFGEGGEAAGVRVFYQAPRFGFLKSKRAHSGWECPTSFGRAASAHPHEAAGSLTAPPSGGGTLFMLPADSEEEEAGSPGWPQEGSFLQTP